MKKVLLVLVLGCLIVAIRTAIKISQTAVAVPIGEVNYYQEPFFKSIRGEYAYIASENALRNDTGLWRTGRSEISLIAFDTGIHYPIPRMLSINETTVFPHSVQNQWIIGRDLWAFNNGWRLIRENYAPEKTIQVLEEQQSLIYIERISNTQLEYWRIDLKSNTRNILGVLTEEEDFELWTFHHVSPSLDSLLVLGQYNNPKGMRIRLYSFETNDYVELPALSSNHAPWFAQFINDELLFVITLNYEDQDTVGYGVYSLNKKCLVFHTKANTRVTLSNSKDRVMYQLSKRWKYGEEPIYFSDLNIEKLMNSPCLAQ